MHSHSEADMLWGDVIRDINEKDKREKKAKELAEKKKKKEIESEQKKKEAEQKQAFEELISAATNKSLFIHFD
jgi:hypothetical protein